MGTRGAYGFRINNQDKVTYNHFDSYSDYLGEKIMEYIAQTSREKMVEVATRIILVSDSSTPSPSLIQKYMKYADTNVGEQTIYSWYCLLRNAQGSLFPYNDDLRHMIDSSSFLLDSLFCEWAYIINLDSRLLEIYKGFNKDCNARGRYANMTVKDKDDYVGVALIKEIPLAVVKMKNIEKFIFLLERLIHQKD